MNALLRLFAGFDNPNDNSPEYIEAAKAVGHVFLGWFAVTWLMMLAPAMIAVPVVIAVYGIKEWWGDLRRGERIKHWKDSGVDVFFTASGALFPLYFIPASIAAALALAIIITVKFGETE